MTAEFGRQDEEDLIDVWGIAASPAGEVLLFDAGSTHLLRLDGDLQLVAAIGRAGTGPGEFLYQRMPVGNWVAADDSGIVVRDGHALSQFDLQGGFKRYVTLRMPLIGVRRIETWAGRVFYVMDDIDRRNGTRQLETWTIAPDGLPMLLRADSMADLPRLKGRVQFGLFVHQADPLWAMHGHCVFISDGSGDWILRVDLLSKQADTLRLPQHPFPELTTADEEWLDDGRRAAQRFGAPAGMKQVKPTARIKWANLLVDPDGFVWLGVWRPPSRRGKPFAAWIVDPSTGAVDSVRVDAFPDAFTPGNAFVARTYDQQAHRIILQKHGLEKSREQRANEAIGKHPLQ